MRTKSLKILFRLFIFLFYKKIKICLKETYFGHVYIIYIFYQNYLSINGLISIN